MRPPPKEPTYRMSSSGDKMTPLGARSPLATRCCSPVYGSTCRTLLPLFSATNTQPSRPTSTPLGYDSPPSTVVELPVATSTRTRAPLPTSATTQSPVGSTRVPAEPLVTLGASTLKSPAWFLQPRLLFVMVQR